MQCFMFGRADLSFSGQDRVKFNQTVEPFHTLSCPPPPPDPKKELFLELC